MNTPPAPPSTVRLRAAALLACLLAPAGCTQEPPAPRAVAPSAAGTAGDEAGATAAPPRRIATH